MTNTERLPHLLTIDQLVERFGTSTRHIRRLIAERRIPYLKVGICPLSRSDSPAYYSRAIACVIRSK